MLKLQSQKYDMLAIGIIKEGKVPADNRVALTPNQCKWILQHYPDVKIYVQPSEIRCYKDQEYRKSGAIIQEDLSDCEWLFGIKEVPINMLIPNKKYMFFSHTRKMQPHNKMLMLAMIEKNITLVDYECLQHDDGQRIIGFGFFAGIVGAHNGMMAYGNRTGAYQLQRVYKCNDYVELIHTYFGLKIPNVKIAVTGSGRVAHGLVEIMNLLDIHEVEPDEYLEKQYDYPVYVHLKGADLYRHKEENTYDREEFHTHPEKYRCVFPKYSFETDILMNGIYWDKQIPRLFSMDTMKHEHFRIKTIADVTDDAFGSVPCNLGDASILDPVYGVDKSTGEKTLPYLPNSVDVMAVGNLPNELPKDASRYFGEQLIKYVLPEIISSEMGKILQRATILHNGTLTDEYAYLKDYATATAAL